MQITFFLANIARFFKLNNLLSMKIVKNVIFIIIGLGFVGAILYKAVWSKPAQAAASTGLARVALPVNLTVAKYETLTETFPVTGSVEANESVMLKSEISGKITGIFFNEGEYVEHGTLLVKVYDDDIRAQIEKAQASLSLAKVVEERQRQLLETDAVSRQEYDVSYANLQAAQADVAILESQLAKTEIRAPFDGTLGFRLVSPGEFITPGVDIAALVNNDPARIQFTVPERHSQLIGVNTVITYRMEGQRGERRATVYAVAPEIDPSTRTLELKAFAPNANGALIPGAFARIEVLLKPRNRVIFIPADAILSETAGQKVYIYRGGRVESVFVETGVRTNDRVEIIKGVAAGDSIITTGIMQITPRTTVTPATVN